MAITIVGSVALDTVKTPFGEMDNALGGAASYFSMAASLYDTVHLVAVIGTDFPERFTGYFRERGVDMRGVQVVEGRTFRWGARYHLDMNARDTLFTELGVFADFHPHLPQEYGQSKVVFLANILPSLQHDVLRQARAVGAPKVVALDTMELWLETARSELTEVMREVDVVMMAEEEVRQYADTPHIRVGARMILGLGPKLLIIKQGSYGALLLGADGSYFAAPAYPLEDLCDSTGAGDAFAGGFLGYLSSRLQTVDSLTREDYCRALIHGNIMGSFACEQFSVERLRQLSQDDITKRYREFVDFTHFEGTWNGHK